MLAVDSSNEQSKRLNKYTIIAERYLFASKFRMVQCRRSVDYTEQRTKLTDSLVVGDCLSFP
ncbi:hypothetical protein KA005_61565, partial [bacterium]|nr:hypothetical protein [bacterium]